MAVLDSYDLLLAGGDVIDVGGGHVGRFDVAISGGRVAAVAEALPAGAARRVLDVSGKLVVPGLIDLHTHVYAGSTFWGIDPDPVAWRSGVTTWIDAGSAGAYTIDGLRRTVGRFGVRVPALLHVSAVGLTAPTGECVNLANCDVDLAIATIAANRDLVVGVKVRMDRHSTGGNGLEPLRRAVAVADAAGVPVMVHIGVAPPAVGELLPLLRPGDIVTHCASGLAEGLTVAALAAAHEAGVLFDIGHGAGGFAFDVLETQLAAGLVPHTISSDLHVRNLYGPVFDLPTTMAKLLAAGLDLVEVVAAATVNPARALGLPGGAGTLAAGAPADIAVFTVEHGHFELVDAHQQRRIGRRRLVNELTLVGGRALPPSLPTEPPLWAPLTGAQRAALRRRDRAVRDLLGAALVDADGLVEQFPRTRSAEGRP